MLSFTETTYFKMAQKVAKYLCYFYKQISRKEISEIAHSGHTEEDTHFVRESIIVRCDLLDPKL